MSLETVENARGRWPGILQALGVDPQYLTGKHGPCMFCGGKDRWLFDDKLNGMWICQQCGHGDGFDLLKRLHGWDFKKCAAEVNKIVGTIQVTQSSKPERTDEDRTAFSLAIWKVSKNITPGDPVWLYLQRRCGITVEPSEVRYHPHLKHSIDGGFHPAMVARVTTPDRKPSGIHRTYLTSDGQKASVDPVRMTAGVLPDGAAVRLAPSGPVLGIAEGLETALCAGLRFGIPVWSGLSANGLEAWEPPASVKQVVVLGDNDTNFTGQAAAFALGKRLRLAGLDVEIRIPDAPGSDWADVHMGRARGWGAQ